MIALRAEYVIHHRKNLTVPVFIKIPNNTKYM